MEAPSYPTLHPELSQRVANALLTHMVFRALSPTLPTHSYEALGFDSILSEILTAELGDKWQRPGTGSFRISQHPLIYRSPIIDAISPNYAYESRDFSGPWLPDEAYYNDYCHRWLVAFNHSLLYPSAPATEPNPSQQSQDNKEPNP